MEIDARFLEPIKQYHNVLRVVEMSPKELRELLPLRINRFCFVEHPFVEPFGFPIDLPALPGKRILELQATLSEALTKNGFDAPFAFAPRMQSKQIRYNGFAQDGERSILAGADSLDPIVFYAGKQVSIRLVEDLINALAVFCNGVQHKTPIKKLLPEGFRIATHNRQPILVCSTKLHGRWDFNDAQDLLFRCILNYIRLF